MDAKVSEKLLTQEVNSHKARGTEGEGNAIRTQAHTGWNDHTSDAWISSGGTEQLPLGPHLMR